MLSVYIWKVLLYILFLVILDQILIFEKARNEIIPIKGECFTCLVKVKEGEKI